MSGKTSKSRKPYVVVRTYSAGVHFGFLASHKGREVVLEQARRLWMWKGAFTLNEVSQHGVAEGSRISEPVPTITLTEAIEIIPTSDEGENSLRGMASFKP